MAHLQEPCPRSLSIQLQYLCLSSEETSWPSPPVNGCRKEQIYISSLDSGQNQGIFATVYLLCYFTSSSPSLCSIIETSTQTQARWFFGTLVHHLLGLLAFWIKLLFLAPTTHLSICHAASSVSLDSVTISTQNPHCWYGRGQGQALQGEISLPALPSPALCLPAAASALPGDWPHLTCCQTSRAPDEVRGHPAGILIRLNNSSDSS